VTVIPYLHLYRPWWSPGSIEWEIIIDGPDDWHQDEGFPPEEWCW